MSRNHGGSTSYYDLPVNELLLKEILREYIMLLHGTIQVDKFTINEILERNLENFLEDVKEAFPKTLSDLIEYKNMNPNLHEVFKATYALEERADLKNKGDKLRELNKIMHYAKREMDRLTGEGFKNTRLGEDLS